MNPIGLWLNDIGPSDLAFASRGRSADSQDDCGGCSGDAPCHACGTEQDDLVHWKAKWANLVASAGAQTEFWKTAKMADAFFSADAGGALLDQGSPLATMMKIRQQAASCFAPLTGQHGVSMSILADEPVPVPKPQSPVPDGGMDGDGKGPGGMDGGGGMDDGGMEGGMEGGDNELPGVEEQCCVADSIDIEIQIIDTTETSVFADVKFKAHFHFQAGPGGNCSFEMDEKTKQDIAAPTEKDPNAVLPGNEWRAGENHPAAGSGQTWAQAFNAAQPGDGSWGSTDEIRSPAPLEMYQYYRVISGCAPKDQVVGSTYLSYDGTPPVSGVPPPGGKGQDIVPDAGTTFTFPLKPGSKQAKSLNKPIDRPKRFPPSDKIKPYKAPAAKTEPEKKPEPEKK